MDTNARGRHAPIDMCGQRIALLIFPRSPRRCVVGDYQATKQNKTSMVPWYLPEGGANDCLHKYPVAYHHHKLTRALSN